MGKTFYLALLFAISVCIVQSANLDSVKEHYDSPSFGPFRVKVKRFLDFEQRFPDLPPPFNKRSENSDGDGGSKDNGDEDIQNPDGDVIDLKKRVAKLLPQQPEKLPIDVKKWKRGYDDGDDDVDFDLSKRHVASYEHDDDGFEGLWEKRSTGFEQRYPDNPKTKEKPKRDFGDFEGSYDYRPRPRPPQHLMSKRESYDGDYGYPHYPHMMSKRATGFEQRYPDNPKTKEKPKRNPIDDGYDGDIDERKRDIYGEDDGESVGLLTVNKRLIDFDRIVPYNPTIPIQKRDVDDEGDGDDEDIDNGSDSDLFRSMSKSSATGFEERYPDNPPIHKNHTKRDMFDGNDDNNDEIAIDKRETGFEERYPDNPPLHKNHTRRLVELINKRSGSDSDFGKSSTPKSITLNVVARNIGDTMNVDDEVGDGDGYYQDASSD